MGNQKVGASLLTMWMFGLAAFAGIATIAVFAAVSAGLFDRTSFITGITTGPSPALALIPLAIGVVAGAVGVVTWTIERNAQPS